MKAENTTKAATRVGMFAALAASLCCITPLLALIAGASGAASSFSWLEPARPVLIGLAVAALAYAWYRALNVKTDAACGPDGSCTVGKKSFMASKTFLSIITIVALLLMAFPYYAKVFYPEAEINNVVIVESSNIQTATFQLKGMTCSGCEEHVNNELAKVKGVIETKTSYAEGTSTVKFDKTKVDVAQLKTAIDRTSYQIINYAIK